MSEAFRIAIPIGYLVVWIILRPVVMCQLDHALPIRPMIVMRGGVWTVIGEEVQVELYVRILNLVDEFEAQELVVFDCAKVWKEEWGLRGKDGFITAAGGAPFQ